MPVVIPCLFKVGGNPFTFYFDEVMSAYRTGVENSMMTNFRNNYSKESDIRYQSNRIETLNMADRYYDYKYHNEIKEVNLTSQVIVLFLQDNYGSLARKTYSEFIKVNGSVRLIKLFLLKRFPSIAQSLVSIKAQLIKFKMKDELDESKPKH